MTGFWRHITLIFFTGIFCIKGTESHLISLKTDEQHAPATDEAQGEQSNKLLQKEAEDPDYLFHYTISPQYIIEVASSFHSLQCNLISQYFSVPTPPPWKYA